MQTLRQIEFTGKNLNDVFSLPCLKSILKVDDRPILVIWGDMMLNPSDRTNACVRVGDTLIEYENGKWSIARQHNSHA